MAQPDPTLTRHPTLNDQWFSATLDSGAFNAQMTLRPPSDDRPADAVTAETFLAIDHAAPTVPPHARKTVTTLDLPRLTWTDEVGGTGHAPAYAHTNPADFALVAVLGEGGMGRVHLAHQHSLDRDVALKTVKAEADRPAVRFALWQEALVMARLDHPNVVPVHVLGVDREGRPALVMKRIDGCTWQALLDTPDHPTLAKLGGRSPLESHLEVLLRVADAVAFAHAHGVLHRDIKPDNVMVGSFGEVYLGDWGVALDLRDPVDPTVPLPIVGTPAYMAPEMLGQRAAALGPATDVFLLGATLHQLLTGEPRHRGKTLREVFHNATHPTPFGYAATVPASLAAIANKACAAVPDQRYATATEFRLALLEFGRNRGLEEVAVAAQTRLAELDAVLARGPGADKEAYIRAVHRLSAEARFGFLEVRRLDPQQAGAAIGLEACLERMIEFELAAGHTAEARALYRELGRSVLRFETAIGQLEGQDEAEASKRAALEQLATDFDPRVGSGVRMFSLGVIALTSVAMCLYAMRQSTTNDVRQITLYGVSVFVLLAGVAAVLRKRIRTAINRQVLFGTTIVIGIIVLHRWLAWQLGETDVGRVLFADAFLIAGVGISQFHAGWPPVFAGVVSLGLAGAMLMWPAQSVLLFSVLTVFFPAVMALPPRFLARGSERSS